MEHQPVDSNVAHYEEDLDFTQRVRRLMIDEITEGGTTIPDKGRMLLLQTLDSMDNQSFRRIERIEGSAVGGAIAAEVGKFMVELAKSAHADPFRVEKPQEVERAVNLPNIDDATVYELSQEVNFGKAEYDSFRDVFLKDNPEYDS